MANSDQSSLSAWLDAHPEITRVEAFVFDLMGAGKGKWLERDKAYGLDTKGLPVPAKPNVDDESAKAEAANGGNLGTVGLLEGPKADGAKPDAKGAVAPAAPKK